jgi:hypothetical protein
MAWLGESGVPGVVIGGVAASLLGRPRLTKDIDLLVSVEPEGWAEFVTGGQAHGLEPRLSDAVEFARRSRVLLMRHGPTELDVDVTLAALPFEEEALRRSVTVEVEGLDLRLASPGDLVIMKAVARRAQDLSDIEGLLDRNPDIDLDRVKNQLREFSAVLGPEVLDDFVELLRRRR